MIEIENNRFLKSQAHVNYLFADQILKPDEDLGALWVGELRAANDSKFLLSKNIQNSLIILPVITVAEGFETIGIIKTKGITYHFVPVKDNIQTAIIDFFGTSSLIQQTRRQGSVLLHCAQGISRSPATAIAYMMWKFGEPFNKARDYIRCRRRRSAPILSLVKLLKGFQNSLYKTDTNQSRMIPNYISIGHKVKKTTPFYQMKRTVHYKSLITKVIQPQINVEKKQQKEFNENELFYMTQKNLNNPQSICKKSLQLSKKWP